MKVNRVTVILLILAIMSLGYTALNLAQNPMPTREVDAVIVVDTDKKLFLIDSDGREVGSLDFKDETTIMIKRRKP